MSKKKLFKLELYNEKTDEVETIEKFKFISWKEARNIVSRAQELDSTENELDAFDKIPELIMSVLGDCKTSDNKKVTVKMLEEKMSVEDMRSAMENVMAVVSGEDPKALPPELQ